MTRLAQHLCSSTLTNGESNEERGRRNEKGKEHIEKVGFFMGIDS